MIALDLGAAHPDRVRSMVLLEPLPPTSWAAASDFADVLGIIGPTIEASVGRYQAGDIDGAYDELFVVQGLDWRAAADAAGPDVAEQGVRDAATFFEVEAPALAEWSFGPEQAAAIDGPVLSWNATPGDRITYAVRAFLHESFPQCENADLDGGDHFSVSMDPAAVAESVAAFVTKHAGATAAT